MKIVTTSHRCDRCEEEIATTDSGVKEHVEAQVRMLEGTVAREAESSLRAKREILRRMDRHGHAGTLMCHDCRRSQVAWFIEGSALGG